MGSFSDPIKGQITGNWQDNLNYVYHGFVQWNLRPIFGAGAYEFPLLSWTITTEAVPLVAVFDECGAMGLNPWFNRDCRITSCFCGLSLEYPQAASSSL